MRPLRPFIVVVLSFVIVLTPTVAQQTSTTIQPSMLLQQSLAVQLGNTRISDVTLIGSVRRIAGSDDETGAVALKAISSGGMRLDFNFPSGPRTEFKSFESNGSPVGSWSGPEGVSHPIALHNLFSEPAWFFPAFAIGRRLANSTYVATYVGHEARDGQTVEHISVSQTPARPNPRSHVSFEHLTQLDFFLDANTFLPVAIVFNTHPDEDALVDIPVEVRFDDYRTVNGARLPFHIQKFINNSLYLDLQFQNAALNTGISTAQVGGGQ